MNVGVVFTLVRPLSNVLQTRGGVLCRYVEIHRCCTAKSWHTQSTRLTATAQGSGEDSGKQSWWNISTEWKVVTSFTLAVTTFFLNARLERQRMQKEMKLNRIQSQIKDLYGPLYGNRLVSDTSYRAVMKTHKGLKKYLHEARLKKDADMIHRWRSYVWNVLYPLDKAAVEMILNNAHLVIEGKFPEEFEQLLIHAARMEFIMEIWKDDKGTLEPTKEFTEEDYLETNNASGIAYRSPILEHVKVEYEKLRTRQREISLEISSEKQTDNALHDLINRF